MNNRFREDIFGKIGGIKMGEGGKGKGKELERELEQER